jgi:peptidoglycan/LPS O-acetylase OafA/YrhL
VAVAGPFLLVAYWMLRPLTSGPWSEITLSLRVAGAFVIVATVAFWPRARTPRIPSRPALGHLLACLGSVSFSLYLVHFPIVVAGALLAGPGRWWLGALISVPLSLLIAQLMTTWVEQPAQKYGTRAGASVSQRIPRPARPTRV